MKKINLIFWFLLLMLFVSADLYGQPSSWGKRRHHRQYQDIKNTVGAPLDGGILAILGAAGIGYFLARKRKKE